MREDFLHYLWKFKFFTFNNLQTTKKEEITILKSGTHNTNAGPDFLNAQLKINNQMWVGNVEIHINASDWYVHNHEKDPNYDAVILHVVWVDDVNVFMKNEAPLPTLVLKPYVLDSTLKNYKLHFTKAQKWILCETSITTVNTFTLEHWKERLYFERLERKANLIQALLKQHNNDFEAVLFILIAKNFGLKVNSEAFYSLATSLSFSTVRKCSFLQEHIEALLFGQAGFLEANYTENYYVTLKDTYTYLKHKYQLKPLTKNQFSFFRMRPHNFPTVRIAQLASVLVAQQNFFSKLLSCKALDDYYSIFKIETHKYWHTHFNFNKTSKFSVKKITKPFVNLLLINTILPLQFLYNKQKGTFKQDAFLTILKGITSEKNTIINQFNTIGTQANNAFDSQALLELKTHYCNKFRCLDCAIGLAVLNKKTTLE